MKKTVKQKTYNPGTTAIVPAVVTFYAPPKSVRVIRHVENMCSSGFGRFVLDITEDALKAKNPIQLLSVSIRMADGTKAEAAVSIGLDWQGKPYISTNDFNQWRRSSAVEVKYRKLKTK